MEDLVKELTIDMVPDGDNRIIGKVEGMSLADMPYGSRPADPREPG